MPIKIPDNLPAKNILKQENIFVISESIALHQDIRPLKIAILNLMPTKITTETQLLRLLGNTPLQVDVDFLTTKSYKPKNAPVEHMEAFYKTFEDAAQQKYDGLVITGAPVEHMDFEQVAYWDELCGIMQWSARNVTSTLHICWGAQAGLYYHYGVQKSSLPEKHFGVFEHYVLKRDVMLLRGFDDVFRAPQSRHTTINAQDLCGVPEVEPLAESREGGVYIAASRDGKHIFVTGHSEYDSGTLRDEYLRDKAKGLDIAPPRDYFPDDDESAEPVVTWRAHANLLFCNWLNYYVYQATPFDINQIK